MTNIELALNTLAEASAAEISKAQNPKGYIFFLRNQGIKDCIATLIPLGVRKLARKYS
jgi:hypothetical protein